ncbi:MAG: hypothetical protein GY787_16185 [Alteromonadales bacterium]|nr:hypothetical protein [Alteromonadales bacterium]
MSGIVGGVKDVFFGGAEKDAAKAQQKGIERGIEATERATAQAREDLFKLFPAAQQNAQQGFQGALDVFGQSLPAQTGLFQGGNVAAQQQILAGLPQFQNAILGGQVDFSQMQPTQLQMPDLSFLQQQLPQTVDPFAPTQQQFTGPVNTGNPLAGNIGGIGAGQFGGISGLFGGSRPRLF